VHELAFGLLLPDVMKAHFLLLEQLGVKGFNFFLQMGRLHLACCCFRAICQKRFVFVSQIFLVVASFLPPSIFSYFLRENLLFLFPIFFFFGYILFSFPTTFFPFFYLSQARCFLEAICQACWL
jgi:hypothetical protein